MEEKVMKILADIVDMDEKEINMETTMENTLDWDSLAHIRLIAEIEDAFSVSIPYEEIANIKSIRDVISFLK